MTSSRNWAAVLGAAIFVLIFAGPAAAFHSGGVAECTGCHSMHSPKTGGTFLLIGSDQSSTCLSCHESANDTGPNGYHVSTADAKLGAGLSPLQRTPGGDFAWLKKTYTYSGGGPENGATHGHNVVAIDKNYVVDPTNTTAPGGTFPSAQLGCTSCHDPHGQYRRLASGAIVKSGAPTKASGSYFDGVAIANNEPTATEAVGVYRLLAGAGYTKATATFSGVPAAKVPSTYNRTEAATQTRVAYGSSTARGHVTWGNWCGTCHPNMHSSGNYVHPIDQSLGSTVSTNYQTYVKSGDLTGTSSTSFTSLVPFIEGTGDYTALAGHAVNDGSQNGGPASNDQVSCMSCHRAHASGMMNGLRFDTEYEFMVKGGKYVGSDNPEITGSRAGLQSRGRTIAEWQAAYYDRPATQFATYQRVLCNKCHAKD